MTAQEAVIMVVKEYKQGVKANEVAYQINLRKLWYKPFKEALVHSRVRHTSCLEKDIYGNITYKE